MNSSQLFFILFVFGIIMVMIHDTYGDGWGEYMEYEPMEHKEMDKKTMKVS